MKCSTMQHSEAEAGWDSVQFPGFSLPLPQGSRQGPQTVMGATQSKQPVSWAHCAGTSVDFHEQEIHVCSVKAQRVGHCLVLRNPSS